MRKFAVLVSRLPNHSIRTKSSSIATARKGELSFVSSPLSTAARPARMKAPDHDQPKKYCNTCGRLISPNHRNFSERKNCSKTCSDTRLSKVDRQLEEMFVKLASKLGAIACSDVEKTFMDENRITPPTLSSTPSAEDANTQKSGMDKAKWRERVRRAGRRVIAFPHGQERFECVQGNNVVESSYAKGEWMVRLIKG